MAQTIIVDISTRGANPVAYTHQGDTGRTFFAEIYENGEAFAVAGYTIKVGAILPADRGYTVIAGNDMVTATKTNDNTTNKIYFTLSDKYSLKAGNGILTLIFTSNTGTPSTIRPINIDLRIQKSADADDTIAGASDFPEGLEAIAEEVFQEYLSTYLPPVAPSASAAANKAADAKLTGEALANLKSDLSNLPYAIYNPRTNMDGKWLNSNGEIQEQSGWSITNYLRIGEKAQFYLKTRVSSDNVRSCFYDKDKNFISSFKTGTEGNNTLYSVNNAKYVRFSIQTSDANDFQYTSVLFIEKIEDITPDMLAETTLIKSFIDNIITGSYYGTNGSPVSSQNWSRTILYKVNEGDTIDVINAQAIYAVLYNSAKEYNSHKETGNTPTSVSFVVPSGVSYIGLNIVNANLSGYSCLVNGVMLGAVYDVPWISIEETARSPWHNKKYISHGDSITWQDGKPYGQGSQTGVIATGYQTVFSDAVELLSYSNEGKSGWAMAVVASNGVVNTILGVSDYTAYDLCTIACGTNDFKLNVPLGSLGAIGDTAFDDTTFYGAYRKAVEHILTNSPTIRLVLMTPLQRNNSGYDVNYTNSAGHKLIDYVNAIKAIGEMYGLPVCDMYSNSGFTQLTLSTYTMDGLHPNDVGYHRMGGYLTGYLNAIGN